MKNKIWIFMIAFIITAAAVATTIIIVSSSGKEIVEEKKNPPSTITVDDKTEKVTITFDSAGGKEVSPLKIKKGDSITLPDTERDGYYLIGWYLDGKKIENGFIFVDDATLVAKWEAKTKEVKKFSVNFDSKGGSKVNKIEVECGKTLKLPKNPTKEGYTFLRWEDKNGNPIYNDVKLYCENVTLYAVWEKNKVYTCPSGYKLNGTKCTINKEPSKVCPTGTREDGNICVKLNDYVQGTRKCKIETVILDSNGHTWTGEGEYYQQGLGICGYYIWKEATTQEQCNNLSGKNKQWGNGKCYAKIINNNYENAGCPGTYTYYSTSDLLNKFNAHNNGGCYKTLEKEQLCDTTNGFVLTAGSCVKTIEATLK